MIRNSKITFRNYGVLKDYHNVFKGKKCYWIKNYYLQKQKADEFKKWNVIPFFK